jgi:tetratricopeptide (TPR) repeat protein
VGEALAYFAMGHKQEADATLDRLVTRYSAEAAYQIAEVFAFRGENDRAFEWLEKAYRQHDAGLAAVKGDPLLKNLWKDPRYATFLKKLHLPA